MAWPRSLSSSRHPVLMSPSRRSGRLPWTLLRGPGDRALSRAWRAGGLLAWSVCGGTRGHGVVGCAWAGRGRRGDDAVIDRHLVADQVEALPEGVHLGQHSGLVLAEQAESLLFIAVSAADQVGVLADGRDRHPGGAEVDADGQPFRVVVGVEPPAAATAADGIGEDALAFVEPQG